VRDLEVRCYAGGRGDETPRAVLLGGREVTVRVERSWIEEPVGSSGIARRRMFQVQIGGRPPLPPGAGAGRLVDARSHGVRSLAIGASSSARGGQADGRAGGQRHAVRIGGSWDYSNRPESRHHWRSHGRALSHWTWLR
jgi:hypothetical protein